MASGCTQVLQRARRDVEPGGEVEREAGGDDQVGARIQSGVGQEGGDQEEGHRRARSKASMASWKRVARRIAAEIEVAQQGAEV